MGSPIAVTTKNEVMYHALRQELLAGEILPGQRLVISDLAEKHSVSPMPVREALKRLQQEGFVDVVPHIGAIAKSVDFQRYVEIVDVRNQLEILAATTAVRQMTAAGIRRLESIFAKMEKAIGSARAASFMDLDRKFHFALYEHSPNAFLVENVAMLWDRCKMSQHVFVWDSVRAGESHREHAEIVAAVKGGKPERTGDLIRQHKARSLEKLRLALGVG